MQILPVHFRTEDGFRWGPRFFRAWDDRFQEKISSQVWTVKSRESTSDQMSAIAFSLGVGDDVYFADFWRRRRDFYDKHAKNAKVDKWEAAARDGIVRISIGPGQLDFAAFDSDKVLGCIPSNGSEPFLSETRLPAERERIQQLHPPEGFLEELVLPESMNYQQFEQNRR